MHMCTAEHFGDRRATKVGVDHEHLRLAGFGDRSCKVDRGERLSLARCCRCHSDDPRVFRRACPLNRITQHAILIRLKGIRLQKRDPARIEIVSILGCIRVGYVRDCHN